jgi:nucleoside 2-deoxyribosyltransferase
VTTFYIATSLSRANDHNLLRNLLIKNDYTITYDWTVHGSVKLSTVERLADVSLKETRGVLSADIVIVLLPGGYGTHAELGMALGSGKQVLIHSNNNDVFTACDKTCAFYHHPNVTKIVGDINSPDLFLEAMEIMDPNHLATPAS